MAQGRVLIVAGSDSGGGAGIQADIKTVTALGGYAATAITALTAQNTQGVFGILDIPAEFVRRQMALTIDDIGVDAIKTGMLHRVDVIAAVCAEIRERAPAVPVVVDPVMVAKGGEALLQKAAQQALREQLLPLAAVLTPNVPEAEALIARAIVSDADMEAAARALLAMGPKAILLKGGHCDGPVVRDWLVTADRVHTFEAPRIETRHTHGTGCTLASAVATGLAQGRPLQDAVARAHAYVQAAIRAAPGFGQGKGPLGHGHTVRPFEPRR